MPPSEKSRLAAWSSVSRRQVAAPFGYPGAGFTEFEEPNSTAGMMCLDVPFRRRSGRGSKVRRGQLRDGILRRPDMPNRFSDASLATGGSSPQNTRRTDADRASFPRSVRLISQKALRSAGSSSDNMSSAEDPHAERPRPDFAGSEKEPQASQGPTIRAKRTAEAFSPETFSPSTMSAMRRTCRVE